MKHTKAFTLIELLIVVAIIAILAAIAVPNFLEAQTRAKVSRAKSDLRTYATGLESYYVDYNAYPMCNTYGVVLDAFATTGGGNQGKVLEVLSTPIAYLTSALMPDAFTAKLGTRSVYTGNDAQPGMGATGYGPNDITKPVYRAYQFHSVDDTNRTLVSDNPRRKAQAWTMGSCGPDNIYLNMGGVLANNSEHQDGRTPDQKKAYCANLIYDPTNGTISFGEIFRVGGNTNGRYAKYFFQTAQTQK